MLLCNSFFGLMCARSGSLSLEGKKSGTPSDRGYIVSFYKMEQIGMFYIDGARYADVLDWPCRLQS